MLSRLTPVVDSHRRKTLIQSFRLAVILLFSVAHSLPLIASELASATTSTPAKARLSAHFYADSSCLMNIDQHIQGGRTVIDASVGEAGSRLMIHCDVDDGGRLTLLARGDGLNIGQRVALLSTQQIQAGDTGMVAWFIDGDGTPMSPDAPRRYLRAGHVLMRATPTVAIAGATLHADSLAFASLDGELDSVATIATEPGSPSRTSDDTKVPQ